MAYQGNSGVLLRRFTSLNIVSVKQTGRFQVLLVGILLAILALFMIFGLRAAQATRYEGFLGKGWPAVLSTAGLVFISFGGLTKVASIAEEVKEQGPVAAAGSGPREQTIQNTPSQHTSNRRIYDCGNCFP